MRSTIALSFFSINAVAVGSAAVHEPKPTMVDFECHGSEIVVGEVRLVFGSATALQSCRKEADKSEQVRAQLTEKDNGDMYDDQLTISYSGYDATYESAMRSLDRKA